MTKKKTAQDASGEKTVDKNTVAEKAASENVEKCDEPETVRMFKDDFDAMQRETEKLMSDLDAAQKKAEKEKSRADEMTAQAQRLQAEFDNYRKRTNETNKQVRRDGVMEALGGILPVCDAVEQAEGMISDESTLSGIRIIKRQIEDLFRSFEVEKIESLGKPFDPKLHNAVMEEDAPDELKGCVTKVYQQGYKIGDKILRHAVVIVGK